MAIASSADNIRFNGTGIAYAAAVASANPGADMGELENFSFSQAVSKDQVKSTRNAARGTILEAVKETDATLKWGLREQTDENLKMALMAASVSTANQTADGVYQTTQTWVADEYIDLGKLDVVSTKLNHGTVTGGPFVIGEIIAQADPVAEGKIAFVGAGFIEVVEVSGAFTAGEAVTVAAKSATLTGVATLRDAVITSADGATRRAQGTDYTIEPRAGYARKLTGGGVLNTDKVSFDWPAVAKKVLYGLSASTVQRKVTFVTDPDDYGPRKRYTFHKVSVSTDGEQDLLGDGTELLKCSGTVIRDTSQPAGEEYYKLEILG